MLFRHNVARSLRQTSRSTRPSWRAYSTGSSSSSSRLPLAATSGSVALAVAGYAVWHINSGKNRVALDARAGSASSQTTHVSHSPPTGPGLPPTPDEIPGPPSQLGPPLPPVDDDTSMSVSGRPTRSPPDDVEVVQPHVEGQPDDEENSKEGAFNPETGEINWDCPCLGGMAHGPCGMEFREAFSCFVFSEAEPKGMDCVEKFRAMQDCFRAHPDVYAEELMLDDEDEELPSPDPSLSGDLATQTPSDPLSSKSEPKSSSESGRAQ